MKVFGFIPDYTGADYFLVSNISVPSTASRAGLAMGDTISMINGKRPAALFQDHCDYFFEVSKLLKTNDTLEVVRKGERMLLVKEDLF